MDLCHIRALRAEEYGRLKEFLYEAIFLPDGAQPLPREVTDDPSLRIYWEGFGREPDDRALCAEAKGQIIGAIWCRMLPEGFGHADRRTPELALAVLAAYRAQGIGSRLIGQMLEALRDAGYAQVSLAVQQANRAHRLYRRSDSKSSGRLPKSSSWSNRCGRINNAEEARAATGGTAHRPG